MITEMQTEGLQRAMALLEGAENGRAAVQEGIGAVQQELRGVEASLGAAREELRSEETRIAVSGSQMPDEPSALEAKIAMLARHQRILTTRRQIFERQELAPAEEQVRAAKEAVEQEWRLIGLKQIENIRVRYREAAAVLRAAYVEYSLWWWQFSHEKDSRDFPRPHKCPFISELAGFELLVNPILLADREHLEAAAPELTARLRDIRADIDACK